MILPSLATSVGLALVVATAPLVFAQTGPGTATPAVPPAAPAATPAPVTIPALPATPVAPGPATTPPGPGPAPALAPSITGQGASPLPPPQEKTPVTLKPLPDDPVFSEANLLKYPRYTVLQIIFATFSNSTQILVQAATADQQRGVVKSAAGEFDTSLNTNLQSREVRQDSEPGTLPEGAYTSRTIDWETNIRRKFRNGIAFQPTLQVVANRDSRLPDPFNFTRSVLSFNIVIPLGKGAGETAADGFEKSAKYDYSASLFSLRHVTANAVYNAVQAYWQCKAAEERFRLQKKSAEVSSDLLRMSLALAKADELAEELLAQIVADQATAHAQMQQAALDLIQARLALALVIGLDTKLLSRAPLTSDPFPRVSSATLPTADLDELTELALVLRDDLRASVQSSLSRRALMDASRINLRPQIDFNIAPNFVSTKAGGQWENAFGGAFSGLTGPGLTLGISASLPFGNDLARGQYISDTAAYDQAKINKTELERQIVSSVIGAWNSLRNYALQLELYHRAAIENERALLAQEELFKVGSSSLTDVITARQRLIISQVAYVNAQAQFAISIVGLRFATGTLLPGDRRDDFIEPASWRTAPFTGPRPAEK